MNPKTYYQLSLFGKGEGGLLFWYPPGGPVSIWGTEKGYCHLIREGQAHKIFKSFHRRGLTVKKLRQERVSLVTATGDHQTCHYYVFEAY